MEKPLNLLIVEDSDILISLSINGDTFKLTVRDNGIGIPEDMDLRNTESLGLQLVTLLTENQLMVKLT